MNEINVYPATGQVLAEVKGMLLHTTQNVGPDTVGNEGNTHVVWRV
jgi:hypothetical protein